MKSGKKMLLLVMVIAAAFVLADFDDADAKRKRKRRRKRRRKKATPAKVVPKAPAIETASAKPADDTPKSALETTDTPAKKNKKKRVQVLDFSGIGIEGRLRTPQLLYFLGRVKEELHRASLEKRSFVPELVRSAEEGGF